MRTPYNYTYLAMGALLFLSFSLVHADDRNKTNGAPPSHSASAPAVHAGPSGGGGSHGAPPSRSPQVVHATPSGGSAGVHTGGSNTPHPSGSGAVVHTSGSNTPHPTSGSNTPHPTSGGTVVHTSGSNTPHPTGGGTVVHTSGSNTPHPTSGSNTPHPTGGGTVVHTSGSNTPHPTGGGGGVHPPLGITRGPNGKVATWRGKSGSEARFDRNGGIRSVRTGGMTIVHGPHGGRYVTTERGDHTRIVTNGAGHGYVQRPFTYRGHEYARRSYYYRGRSYSTYYRSYSYRNIHLSGYAPFHYYSPVFYGWAYHPWLRPVDYGWGWYGSPWYSYYGGYFTPWRTYPGAAFWLTDYLIASSLQDAYQQQVDAQAQGSPDAGGAALSPEVKQMIADEVQRQLALENSERQQVARNIEPDPASSGLPRMLADGASHVFVVSNTLDVSDSTGQSCEVTEGDVLRLQTPPPQDATAGFLNVLASKGQDCPR
jgi:hypothetical protein